MATARDLAPILGDLLRKKRCAEVKVEYSCGHQRQVEVVVPSFLCEKEPRAAARALRLACKVSAPYGEEGIFQIEVPAGSCSQCSSGQRGRLLCGAVSMDLRACEAFENPIPVGIGFQQFTTWVQSSELQNIPLTSCKGSLTWRQYFMTPGSLGPILVAMFFWLLGCLLYASWTQPFNSMASPEAFYAQVQEQIANIPVPRESPHYSHYRRYYLEQYQEHLALYLKLKEDYKLNRGPWINWNALLQGLGLGTWFFVAMLAFCEYRYTTVTAWMESVEEAWIAWRRSRLEGRAKRKTQRKKKEDVKDAKPSKEKLPAKVQPPERLPEKLPEKEKCEPEEAWSRLAYVRDFAMRIWPRPSREADSKLEEPSATELEVEVKAEEDEEAQESPEALEVQGVPDEDPAAEPLLEAEEEAVEPDEQPVLEAPMKREISESEMVETEETEEAVTEDEQPVSEAPMKREISESEMVETQETEETVTEVDVAEELKAAAEACGTSDDGSWQMVTKGRAKAAKVESEPEICEPEPPTQVPANLENLSTEELIELLQSSSLRRQLLRRGVPIRETLMKWLKDLQAPKAKARQGAPPKAAPKEEKVALRAEAPEFYPEPEPLPEGPVLVPCMLPACPNGSLAPAGVLLLPMGPEAVPSMPCETGTGGETPENRCDQSMPIPVPMVQLLWQPNP